MRKRGGGRRGGEILRVDGKRRTEINNEEEREGGKEGGVTSVAVVSVMNEGRSWRNSAMNVGGDQASTCSERK